MTTANSVPTADGDTTRMVDMTPTMEATYSLLRGRLLPQWSLRQVKGMIFMLDWLGGFDNIDKAFLAKTRELCMDYLERPNR